jgi:acyl-coenzyme A thioesterase PaaI-like protein
MDPDVDPLAAHAAATASLRRLGHALVARDVDDEVLDHLAEVVASLADEVEASPVRDRLAETANRFLLPPTSESPSSEKNLFRESIVAGDLNALGIGAELWTEGHDAIAEVTLGAAFEGAPGRSHGGIVAAIFDETMGIVLALEQTAAYTGTLSVTYRAGTPVGSLLRCRCSLDHREGRKLFITGELRAGDLLCAEAEAIFITVEPERFAQGA